MEKEEGWSFFCKAVVLLMLLVVAVTAEADVGQAKYAVVESCAGCRLVRLKQVLFTENG